MSTTDDKTSVASPSKGQAQNASTGKPELAKTSAEEKSKGKGKAADLIDDDEGDDEDEDDDDDEDEEDYEMADEDEEDEDENEDEIDKIDPSVILPPGRRTRGIKIDYSSKEAQEKAGLTHADEDDDE